MKHLPHPPLLLAACLALLPLAAAAQFETADGRLRLSGFGTLGVATTDEGDVAYSQPGRLDGVRDGLNLKLDTKLAVQARYKLNDTVTATVQLLSKHRPQKDFNPEVEWAFLRWDASPSVSLRAGRLVSQTFMLSDARDVHYTQLTARPPMDVYGQVPVNRFEGGDFTYRFEMADTAMQASVWGGRSRSKFAALVMDDKSLVTYELRHLIGVNLMATMDNGVSLRAGTAAAKVSIRDHDDLQTGSVSPSVLAALQGFYGDGDRIRFTGIGASYDRDRWLVNAEYTVRQGDSRIPDTQGWYANTGYRVGAFTPYIGFSKVRVTDANRSNPFQAALGQAVPLASLAAEVQRFMEGLHVSQRTTILGVRWDAASTVAVKLQLNHINKPANSSGWFYAPEGGFSSTSADFYANEQRINLLSLTLDFVF
jgi:hypothetical protein